jgi:uncharacterized lipoprotein YddW (UPF0748 family)
MLPEHAGARNLLAVCLALLTFTDRYAASPNLAEPAAEVRALWVTRSTLVSPESISRMVSAAQNGGFNTIVMQVRGRGDAYYRSSFEPRPADLASRPHFDPLAEAITLAHGEGIQVHAWVAVNLVASAVDLPTSRQHLIARQPDWLMVPKALARGLNRLDPTSPEYVARLARWTRSRPTEVEGLYSSPIHPWAAAHVTAVITELAANYEVDGIHLDYVRFPSEEFDYSRTAIQQFKRAILPELSAAEKRAADAQERKDPLAYPELFRDRWTAFRRSRLTALVGNVRAAVKAVRPNVVLSAAVVPEHAHATDSRLQDWRTWLDQSLVDVVCPMAYTPDVAVFERQISEAQDLAPGRGVWAGIGAYQLTASGTLQHIAAARRLKTAGVILFSYDSLVSPPNSIESLTELGRAAFGAGSQ